MEITKEQLILLWAEHCEEKVSDPDNFISYGSDSIPCYTIRMNDYVSITIERLSENKYYLNLIFSDIIRYKSFEIDQLEFEGLSTSWEAGLFKASKKSKDEIIKRGLYHLERLIPEIKA